MLTTNIVIAGLPESGKTTFLAALWAVLTMPKPSANVSLRLGKLDKGDYKHLNALAERWRNGERQERTIIAEEVEMSLIDSLGHEKSVCFPDLSGESFKRMWSERRLSPSLRDVVDAGSGLLLFLHADKFSGAPLTVDVAKDMEDAGMPLQPIPREAEDEWNSDECPTQVILTDILQHFKRKPLEVTLGRMAVILSAWDKVESDGLSPHEFFCERFPLLSQFLSANADVWDWKLYALSAQGTDYKPTSTSDDQLDDKQLDRLEQIFDLECASLRIKVVSDDVSSDISGPLVWLMQR